MCHWPLAIQVEHFRNAKEMGTKTTTKKWILKIFNDDDGTIYGNWNPFFIIFVVCGGGGGGGFAFCLFCLTSKWHTRVRRPSTETECEWKWFIEILAKTNMRKIEWWFIDLTLRLIVESNTHDKIIISMGLTHTLNRATKTIRWI